MKTIFYLGNDIDVSNLIPIDIRITSLGLDKLTITKFNGKFLNSIEYDGSTIIVDQDNPFIVNIDEVKTLKLNLKLENLQSLPTHIYIETKELFEHTSILMFSGGAEPEDIILPPKLFLDYDPIVLDTFHIETNKNQSTNNNIGSFEISNSGSSNLIITDINFVDTVNEQNIIKDFMSFRDSNGNDFVTLAPGDKTTFFIDIDTRTSGVDAPTNTFLEEYDIDIKTNESTLEVRGHIEIISNDGGIVGSKNNISVSGGAYAPLIGFEVLKPLREKVDVSELIFNYKYNKENTKDLENILKIYNLGNMDLILSDITTNYSISESNSIVYPITTSDLSSNVTIAPGDFFEFNFIFDSIKRANKLDENEDPILNSPEDYKQEVSRNLTIKSNALNYGEVTDVDYGVAFTNNTAINKREFLSSVWYEESPYAWYPIERNEFIFSLLQPGGRNLQKLQIYNGSSFNPEETFRIEIVYHGAEVGTNAFLSNEKYKNQLSSKDSIFVDVNKNSISGETDRLGELQTYVNVSLSMEADEDRYTEGERETSLAQGGDPTLIGHIRKKYDFIKDRNPFKILITRVTDNQGDSNGNTTSYIDPKNQKEYWDVLDGTGLPESLLLFLHAVARRIVYSSNSLATISSSGDIDLFDSTKVTPIIDSFSIVSLSTSLDLGSEFKGEPYGIHQFTTFSYSSVSIDIQGYLETSSNVFVPKVYSYSIGNLSIYKPIELDNFYVDDYFDTRQKVSFSYNLGIASLIGSNIDASIKQFRPSIPSYSLASLASYVGINDMQDGTSVEVNTGFIQGYVPPDPTTQPPILSSALASLSIREFESNNAWNGDVYPEYWNFLRITQFDPFIAEEIKSHSIASLSLLKSTININTPLTWGVKRIPGNTFKGFNVASLAIGVNINDMVDGTSVELIQWTPPPPSEIYSYSLMNINVSEATLLKGVTKEWGIHQATATTHPELAISIYSSSIISLSLKEEDLMNKPLGSSGMFGVTRYDPSSDPPIISHAVVTIAVEDVKLGELYAS